MSDMGDEVYQPDDDASEVREDAGVLEPEDTLIDRGVDSALDEGYSPPEKPLAAETHGTTAEEQREREPLDERLARESDAPAEVVTGSEGRGGEAGSGQRIDQEDPAEVGSAEWAGDERAGTVDELGHDTEAAGRRAGRLLAPDEGTHPDREKDTVGTDVGIDGGAASAEEAAVHVVSESEEPAEAEEGGEPPGS
ncbi:DUF5709 domain-containing protein [Streptomyces oceani]|uniref:DUF5709 domain-containing protein n=1 Tax=Streptomyces oceani TaxID=1075402 RepID=A0A1E7KGZ0_9ACTN|nr:DUF5709 domain-containing protein [Streptomyces oceani]OEV03210.1 hypothetical protein AN216_12775 [Streptomyces oceani]